MNATQTPAPRRLYRSRMDRKLAGVAGGIAAYFDIDATLVRVLMVVALLPAGPFVPLAYLLLAWLIPAEPAPEAEAVIPDPNP